MSRQRPVYSFHAADRPPTMLRFGTALRVFDKGSHRPVLFLMERADGALQQWVVKCAAKDGGIMRPLLHEVAAADLCAWFGILTPEIGLARCPKRPPPTDQTEAGRAAAAMFRKCAGELTFCSRHIAGDIASSRVISRRRRPEVIADAIRILLFDLLFANYDRLDSNPNLMLSNSRLVAIDHERAFFGAHQLDEAGLPWNTGVIHLSGYEAHPASRIVKKHGSHDAWLDFVLRLRDLDEGALREMSSKWPTDLTRGPKGLATTWVDDMLALLQRRRSNALTHLKELRRVVL